MTRMQRDKGLRIERELVELHRGLRLRAERVPLSGAQRYQGNLGSSAYEVVAGAHSVNCRIDHNIMTGISVPVLSTSAAIAVQP